jgi:hypothetical protein
VGDPARSPDPIVSRIPCANWSALICAVGNLAYQGVATHPSSLRLIGFAMAPLALGSFVRNDVNAKLELAAAAAVDR